MNIFYTHPDPDQCALEHCHIHRRKMITEYAQILSTAYTLTAEYTPPDLYKPTHINHPSVIWARSSAANFLWLLSTANSLATLFELASNRPHGAARVLNIISVEPFPEHLPSTPFTEPPVAAPDTFKALTPTTFAYQSYLNSKFAEWASRPKPLIATFDTNPSWLKTLPLKDQIQ